MVTSPDRESGIREAVLGSRAKEKGMAGTEEKSGNKAEGYCFLKVTTPSIIFRSMTR